MSLFQKRHYEWLARFADANLSEQQCRKLAEELARDNSRFDRGKFLAACDVLAKVA